MTAYRTDRALPAHITIPNWSAYQVRIVRDGQEYSASFGWNEAGPQKALSEAVAWRDKMLESLPDAGNEEGQFRSMPLRHKFSWSRVGVTRYVSKDYRKPGHPEYLRFGVNWTDSEGRRRITSFQVGRLGVVSEADERHAANTAEAFRAEWEFCTKNGFPFEAFIYKKWKDEILYPFSPERHKSNIL